MSALVHDLRYAARQLLRTPGFTAAAVVTLALGIAVNTAFFAVVNAVVFRPVRSVQLEGVYVPSFDSGRRRMSFEHFRLLETSLPDSVEAADAQVLDFRDVIVHVPGRAERVQMLAVSGGHAAVFRLQPQAGRFITQEEDRAGVRSAVISDRLWREWFAGDREIVERQNIRINNDVFQVVGVAPPGYRGTAAFGLANTDVWVPLGYFTPSPGSDRFPSPITTYVRLKSGVSAAAAAPELHAAIREADARVHRVRQVGPRPPELRAVSDGNPFRTVGIALLWLSSLVLVAACANLANMLYVRGVHRRAEMAVRQALGASTGRIFRLLLAEALMIGALATGLGLLLALAATRQFGAMFPLFRDRATRVTIDLTPDYFVLAYAFAAGVAAALLVGVASAWRASRVPPLRGMAAGDAATSVTRTSRHTRLGLVALQVGAAVVLLMSAALFFQQNRNLFEDRLSFDTKPLATARVALARHGYTEQDAQAFFRRLAAAVRALPGVDEVAISDGMPRGAYMGGAGVTFAAERTDRPYRRYIRPSNPRVNGTLIAASPGFLRTLGLRVRHGRDLVGADAAGAELVVVVSRSLADRFWPDADPLGRRLMFGNDGHWRTVVGVFDDAVSARRLGPQEFSASHLVVTPHEQRFQAVPAAESAAAGDTATADAAPAADAATPVRRSRPPREMLVVMRSSGARGQLDALRAEVAALDPNVAVFDASTVDESILAAKAPLRAGRLLMGALGLAALAIATLGVYSVVSFLVARRTREFGIRLALGARRRQILKMVVDEAVYLLLVGLFAGVFVYAVGERILDARTYGMMPNEISTWAVVLLLMLAIGLAAALIPARRAAGIDPNAALRDL